MPVARQWGGMQDGDIVVVSIAGVGELTNRFG